MSDKVTAIEVVKPERPYTQLVVWRGMIVNDGHGLENFIEGMKQYGFDVKYAEEYETLATPGEPLTGGRNDVLFYLHEDGVNKFAMWRMQMNGAISWWEDYKSNESNIIPSNIKMKYPDSWDATIDESSEGNTFAVCDAHRPNTTDA